MFFWIMFACTLFSVKSNESLTMELRLNVEGNTKSLIEHINDQNQSKYDKRVFRKYVRLYNLDPKKLPFSDPKFHIYGELRDARLDDFAQQCLYDKNYFIFKSAPFLNIRPIIGVIFGCTYDANSHFILSKVQIKIETKMFKKELKVYRADKERFEHRHYLDTFDQLTQKDRDLCWATTHGPRELLNSRMNNNK